MSKLRIKGRTREFALLVDFYYSSIFHLVSTLPIAAQSCCFPSKSAASISVSPCTRGTRRGEQHAHGKRQCAGKAAARAREVESACERFRGLACNLAYFLRGCFFYRKCLHLTRILSYIYSPKLTNLCLGNDSVPQLARTTC